MVDQIPNYAQMFKILSTFQLPKSVKDLLGPAYQHVNTWGDVDAALQNEVHRKSFTTPQVVANMVLQKCHDFHDKVEAHKASIHQDKAAAWRQNRIANSSNVPGKVPTHRGGRTGKAATRKVDDLLPVPGHGDLGPPPTLAPGESLLDGSLTALKPKIQPFAGMMSEPVEAATAPAPAMGIEENSISRFLLDEDFVMGEGIPSLEAGIKLASGSANVMVAPVATAAHSTDEDDVMEDWTGVEEDTEMADA